MSNNRSFVLAAIIASATAAFTAVPAFASPDRAQAPVAMSGTRQQDREVPVVEHQDRTKVAPTSDEAATAPVTIVVVHKVGFATDPVVEPVYGFGVHLTADEAANTRFGFARAGAVAKVGFAKVQ
jgi:hypothetical protein